MTLTTEGSPSETQIGNEIVVYATSVVTMSASHAGGLVYGVRSFVALGLYCAPCVSC